MKRLLVLVSLALSCDAVETRPAGKCLPVTPSTRLYEDYCHDGTRGYCLLDRPPEGF